MIKKISRKHRRKLECVPVKQACANKTTVAKSMSPSCKSQPSTLITVPPSSSALREPVVVPRTSTSLPNEENSRFLPVNFLKHRHGATLTG